MAIITQLHVQKVANYGLIHSCQYIGVLVWILWHNEFFIWKQLRTPIVMRMLTKLLRGFAEQSRGISNSGTRYLINISFYLL